MHIYIYAYMQIYVQYTYIYIYIRIHTCVYTYIYSYICIVALFGKAKRSSFVLRHRGVPTARSQHYSMVWWLMSTPCGHKASTASLQHHGEPLTIAPLIILIQCMWPLWSIWQARVNWGTNGSTKKSQRHQDCEYKSHQPPAWWLSHTWNHDFFGILKKGIPWKAKDRWSHWPCMIPTVKPPINSCPNVTKHGSTALRPFLMVSSQIVLLHDKGRPFSGLQFRF